MTTPIDRRSLLTVAGAAGVAAGLVGATVAHAANVTPSKNTAPQLPTDPESMLRTLVRIQGTTGTERVTWKTRIVVYAVQPTGVQPLIALRGSESSWWERRDERTWVRYSSTLSFFEELGSNRFVEEFRNPLNGYVGKVPASFIRHKEGEFFTTNGEYFGSMKRAFPQSYPEEPLHPEWTLEAGFVRLRAASNFPPILKQPTREVATLSAPVDQLFDTRIATPAATVSGWNIRPWEPWLGMGDAPGHVIWHFDGVKLQNVEQHDADYLQRARAYTPLFDRSPKLDEGPSFFERILTRQPNRAAT